MNRLVRRFRRNPEPEYSEQYKKMIQDGGFDVVFDFGPDGDFTSKIEGLSGPSCSHVQENFINDMGVALEHHATDDYFKKPPPVTEESDVIRIKPTSKTEVPITKFKPTATPKKTDIQKEKEKEKYRRQRRLSRRNPVEMDVCEICENFSQVRAIPLTSSDSPRVSVCKSCAPWLFKTNVCQYCGEQDCIC